jgi:glycosyltransferase involved in cell wall biosynthesis
MKKILYFITQSEFGGAQRYVFDLANSLKNDFQIAVAMGDGENNGKLAKILDKNSIKYFTIPNLKRNITPVNDLLAFFEIIKLINNYQPDIIHLNSSKISILGSLATLLVSRSRIRLIYTVHGWVFNEPLPTWQRWFYKFTEKFTARLKDKIICVSEYDRQTAIKYKIAPSEKLITIHNGLAPIDFYPREKAREILHLPNTNLLVGSLGNLYKTKGYEYLIEAANILISDYHLPLTFIIIGEGAERKNLENLIKKYNLENKFILAGQIDEAAKLLPAFNFYVCSSVKEGLPYSILEAMSTGLPIVTTKVGGVSEMIEHDKTGLLVKPASALKLAENIKILIQQPVYVKDFGRQAQAEVKSKFSLEKMVEETKRIY